MSNRKPAGSQCSDLHIPCDPMLDSGGNEKLIPGGPINLPFQGPDRLQEGWRGLTSSIAWRLIFDANQNKGIQRSCFL